MRSDRVNSENGSKAKKLCRSAPVWPHFSLKSTAHGSKICRLWLVPEGRQGYIKGIARKHAYAWHAELLIRRSEATREFYEDSPDYCTELAKNLAGMFDRRVWMLSNGDGEGQINS